MSKENFWGGAPKSAENYGRVGQSELLLATDTITHMKIENAQIDPARGDYPESWSFRLRFTAPANVEGRVSFLRLRPFGSKKDNAKALSFLLAFAHLSRSRSLFEAKNQGRPPTAIELKEVEGAEFAARWYYWEMKDSGRQGSTITQIAPAIGSDAMPATSEHEICAVDENGHSYKIGPKKGAPAPASTPPSGGGWTPPIADDDIPF